MSEILFQTCCIVYIQHHVLYTLNIFGQITKRESCILHAKKENSNTVIATIPVLVN